MHKKNKIIADKEKRLRKEVKFYQEKEKQWKEAISKEMHVKLSIKAISKTFSVHFDALRRRLSCGMQVNATPEKPTEFTREKENQLKEWVFELSDYRFAVIRSDVFKQLMQYLIRRIKATRRRSKLANRW